VAGEGREDQIRARAPRGSRPWLLVATLALVVALAGCDWASFGYDPAGTRVNPWETGMTPDVAARLEMVWKGMTGGAVSSSPAVVGGDVYVGSTDGRLHAFRPWAAPCANVCAPRWTADVGGPPSSPAVADGVVYVGSADRNLYAFDAGSGHERWRLPIGGAVASPTVVGGVVYVGSADGYVSAVRTSGSLAWRAQVGAAVSSTPAVAAGHVYVGAADGRLHAFTIDGWRAWRSAAGGAILSSPAVANGLVFVGSLDGRFSAFAAVPPTPCPGAQPTCSPVWSYTAGAGIWSSPAVERGGFAYVASLDGILRAFETDGSVRWSVPVGGPVNSSPAVANGVVYVGSLAGALSGFATATGVRRWYEDAGGPVVSSPAVANGSVFVGNQAGAVSGFRSPLAPLDPSLDGATLTPNLRDTYSVAVDGSALTIAAPAQNKYAGTRVLLWDRDGVPSTDQESCATWSASSHDFHQEGAALRVTNVDGVTRGLTVTKNIYAGPQDYGNYAFFNVHTWDTGEPSIATLIAQFDLRPVFFPEGELLAHPWRMCARAVAGTLSFVVWPSSEPQPQWDDGVHGGSVFLPAGWDQPGHAGVYAGHLLPAGTLHYDDRTVAQPGSSAAPAPSARSAGRSLPRAPLSIPHLP
jgi:outer membrane protein assembly factor BamB